MLINTLRVRSTSPLSSSLLWAAHIKATLPFRIHSNPPAMFRRNSYDSPPMFDPAIPDSDNLLFDLDEYKPQPFGHGYTSSFDSLNDHSPNFPLTPASSHSMLSPSDPFDSGLFSGLGSINLSPPEFDNQNYPFSEWLNDGPTESSAPIAIPPPSPAVSVGSLGSADSSSFVSYNEFPIYGKSYLEIPQYSRSSDDFVDSYSISPHDTSLHPPPWASRLWDTSLAAPSRETSPDAPLPLFDGSGGDNYATQRQRFPIKRDSTPISQIFMSSSAPSVTHIRERTPSLARTYSRRAESFSESDDRDATIRRTKRVHVQDAARIVDRPAEGCTCAPLSWFLHSAHSFLQPHRSLCCDLPSSHPLLGSCISQTSFKMLKLRAQRS